VNQHIPTDPRHLIYHKETQTEHGVMPAFYIEVEDFQLAEALAAGGIDVTDSLRDQQAYQR
jgi:hypothetical protein